MFCSLSRWHTILIFVPALFLLLADCRAKNAAASPSPRYAVVRFENLSGDPALDWVGRAASESLPVMLGGALDGPVLDSGALNVMASTLGPRPVSAPGISTERAEALAAGANRVLSGYLDRAGGQIRMTMTEEDLPTHKTLRVVSASGATPMETLNRLAHNLSPRAGQPPTSNSEAFQDWATGIEAPTSEGLPLLEKAVQLDPNFGLPWVALVGAEITHGDRTAALDAINRSRQHQIAPLSRARVDLLAADMDNDKAARNAAMRKVVSLSPADTLLLRVLADSELSAGQFTEGAADWKKMTDSSPNDPAAWNSLGYARAYAGDYAGALDALRRYENLRPKDANPSDSMGDVNYFFSKFPEAAADYLAGYRKQPDFNQYAELYKAAWAKFRAGDKTGADALFAQFRTARLKAQPHDDGVHLLEADWLYRTGRQQQAFAALRTLVAQNTSPRAVSDAYAQLTIFDLVQNDRTQAAKEVQAMGPRVSDQSALVAEFAAQPSASADEWQARANRLPPSAPLREAALAWALLLDGKRAAAIPVWKTIAEAAPATDFFVHAVYDRLKGKVVGRPLLPDPANLNQFACVLDKI